MNKKERLAQISRRIVALMKAYQKAPTFQKERKAQEILARALERYPVADERRSRKAKKKPGKNPLAMSNAELRAEIGDTYKGAPHRYAFFIVRSELGEKAFWNDTAEKWARNPQGGTAFHTEKRAQKIAMDLRDNSAFEIEVYRGADSGDAWNIET